MYVLLNSRVLVYGFGRGGGKGGGAGGGGGGTRHCFISCRFA